MSDPTRDYKKEYAEYHSTPEAKRDRAKRNLWNRRLKGKVPPGKEIDHTVPLSRGGSNDRDNIRFRDISENRGHGMSKRSSVDRAEGRKYRAVIIEGNPFYTRGRDAENYRRYYNEIKEQVHAAGYDDVIFDEGADHTVPPSADLWVGHSRGADRLRFAPSSTRTLDITKYEDGIDEYNARIEKEMRRRGYKSMTEFPIHDRPAPGPEHYTLTPRAREAIMAHKVQGMSKRAAPLTSRGRNQVAEGNFALPGRRYPIHDISHARNALSRVAQHGTRGEQEAVRSAVEARYPSLKKEGEFMPLYKEASVPFSTRTFTPGYTLGGAVLGGAAGLATSGQSGARALGGAGALSEEDGRDANPFLRAAIGAGLGALGGYGVKRLRDASHLSDFANLKEGDKVLKAHHYSLDNAAAHSGESAKDFVLRARAGRGSAKETALYKADGDKIMGIDTPAIEAVYDRGSKKTHYLVQDPKNPSSASLVSNVDKPFPLNKRDYVRIERADVDKAFLDDVKKQRSSARLQGAAALAAAGGVGGALALSSREKRASWVMSSLTFAKLAGVKPSGSTSRKRGATRHVLITGHSGAGKSTLARSFDLPIHALDDDPEIHAQIQRQKEYAARNDGRLPSLDDPTYNRAMRRAERRAIARALELKDPHVVEGAYLLNRRPDDFRAHELHLVDVPPELALAQRVERHRLRDIEKGRTWSEERAAGVRMRGQQLIDEYEPGVKQWREAPYVIKHRREGNEKLAGVEYRGRTFPGYNQPIEAPPGDTHKMMVLAKKGGEVKLVRFGHRGYQHNYSPEAKANYLKRSAGIRDKSGNLTKDDPFSPNYWARKHLWPRGQEADGRALRKEASGENYRHRATILLRDKEGRVLAVPQKGFTTVQFPGGGIHEDERFDMPTEAEIIEGARREAREELGHDLANPRYIGDLRNEMDERFRERQTLKRGVPIHGLHEHYVVAERGPATRRAHGSAGDTFQGDYMPVDDILWHMDKDARGLSEGAGHAAREAALLRKHLQQEARDRALRKEAGLAGISSRLGGNIVEMLSKLSSAKAQSRSAGLIKNAVDVQGLRSMWDSTVKPLYARAPRSYSKAARSIMDQAATAEGVNLEKSIAEKLSFTPTPNLPKFNPATGRAYEAVATLAHPRADRLITSGKNLIDAKGLSEGAAAGRRALITRRAKTYGDSGGVVYVQPGSSYANLAKAERAQERAVNRFKSKLRGRPKVDHSAHTGLSGEDQEVFNRIVGGHEAREVRIGAKRDMMYRKDSGKGVRTTPSDAEFQSHVMPSVILKNDMNIVNTLPDTNRLVKERFVHMRRSEINDLIKELPQHKESLESVLQGKRLSRHVINRIDRDYAAVKGWKKTKRSEMTRRRAELRAVREKLRDAGSDTSY